MHFCENDSKTDFAWKKQFLLYALVIELTKFQKN